MEAIMGKWYLGFCKPSGFEAVSHKKSASDTIYASRNTERFIKPQAQRLDSRNLSSCDNSPVLTRPYSPNPNISSGIP